MIVDKLSDKEMLCGSQGEQHGVSSPNGGKSVSLGTARQSLQLVNSSKWTLLCILVVLVELIYLEFLPCASVKVAI